MDLGINHKFILFVLIFFVSACSKRNRHNFIKTEAITVAKLFNAGISGIECKLCAKTAVDSLKKIPDIVSVEFICKDGKYEEGSINFLYNLKNKNINIQAIEQSLKNESFTLKNISGEFVGVIKQSPSQEKRLFLSDFDISFKLADIIQSKKIPTNIEKSFMGTLRFNMRSGEFWFYLDFEV